MFRTSLIVIVFFTGIFVGMFMFRATDWFAVFRDWRQDDDTVVIHDDEGNGVSLETISESQNVIISTPAPTTTIGLPLVVTGRVRVFENTFNYRLLDADGTELVSGHSTAGMQDSDGYSSFTITTSYSKPTGTTGTLEVFDYSAKDGSVIDLARVPIAFSAIDDMTVKLYWTASANTTDCSQVVMTERRVPKTAAVAHAAITELLAGTNTTEQSNGYLSSIPSGVVLKSIAVKDGVVDLEVSKEIDVGGSCRMAAIRAQIETTLKQFPTVTAIGIRVEGKDGDESLQP